jgi:hypothetical protein
MTASSAASFEWFWQPPQLGDPGIMMIVDTHPGPHDLETPFVQEDIGNVLLACESRIPTDVHLFQLRIYVKDIIGLWVEIEFTLVDSARRFKMKAPTFGQSQLSEVWDNHEARAGRQN